jgi:hypothetical protein
LEIRLAVLQRAAEADKKHVYSDIHRRQAFWRKVRLRVKNIGRHAAWLQQVVALLAQMRLPSSLCIFRYG